MIAFLMSLWFYSHFKKLFSFAIRISVVGGCAISLIVSIIPSLAIILVISFLPSYIYHLMGPLTFAPFAIGIIGFVGMLSVVILLQEFFSIMNHSYKPPMIGATIVAWIIFGCMISEIHNGLLDYNILFHSQKILRYASSGTNSSRLKKIYSRVSQGHDAKLFDEFLSLLAKNPKSPPDLLHVIYNRTLTSDLDAASRDNIFLSLTANPNASPDLLEKIMLSFSQAKTISSNYTPVVFLSPNINFSPDALLQLAAYPDCEVRRAIISYPKMPENVLNGIVHNDPDVGVRRDAKRRLDYLRGVFYNEQDKNVQDVKSSSLTQWLEQAKSSVDSNQLAIIYNETTKQQNSYSVLEGLASNCFITDELARKIYTDANKIQSYSRTAILKALSINPKTPVDILNQLAVEKDLAILRALVSNPNVPPEAMKKLVIFPDCKIRKKIICMPDAAIDDLKQLRNDADKSVALEASERLNREEEYLHVCKEIKKINPSCQKFYGTTTPVVRTYPNTSEAKPKDSGFHDHMLSFLKNKALLFFKS